MACPHCGSWSVIADRSLAGRMVCGRCGRPLGGGAQARPRRRRIHWRFPGLGRMLIALLLLSALLTWWADSQGPRFSPPAAPGTPALGS